MSSGEALRAQLWQRPDDLELLRVYADWLVEHGDPARGEFIQLSVLTGRSAAQEKRRAALLRKHGSAWVGPASPFVYSWRCTDEAPGFVSEVKCSAMKLVAGFDAIRALGPRLTVTLAIVKTRREVAALATLPLGALYGLALCETDADWVTDHLLSTLGPRLAGLRSLVLHAAERRASERGWAEVLPHLGSLERLDLTMGANAEAWLELLLEAPAARSLRALCIPSWVDPVLRERLTRELGGCEVSLRPAMRLRFDPSSRQYQAG